MLEVTMTTVGGVSDTLTLEKNGLTHLHTEFTPGSEVLDISTILVSAPIAMVDNILLEFVPHCPPEHPFYVRWINREGGYDYKMFEARSWFTRSTSSNKNFTEFQVSTPDARKTQERLSFEAKEIHQVGAANINYEEFHWISAIQFSPKIEYFDPGLTLWKLITVEGNSSAEWDAGGITCTFEIKFRLPNPNIQL